MSFDLTPAEFRAKWADALESGKYEQATGVLAEITPEGPRYCCLGVACEVFIENGGQLPVGNEAAIGQSKNAHSSSTRRRYGTEDKVLPPSVKDALGVASVEGVLSGEARADTGHSTLTGLNDSGSSFATIAKVIRGGGVRLAGEYR